MKYKNEKQLMEKLNIESWRNLSKDKIVQFAAMMPDMDKEVMFKVMEQFPEFTKFGGIVLESLEESVKQITESNSEDYSKSLKVINYTQLVIKEQLDKQEISSEERKYLMENLMKIAEMVRDMDHSNRRFLKKINTDNLKAVTMLALTTIVIFGGKIVINELIGNEEDR